MRYKLITAYDGTNYSGWQVQKNAQSIQPLIQKALEKVLRHPIDLTGSGRTDAGVHANAQTAHFDTEAPIEPARLIFSLNGILPSDVRILSIEQVANDFHARYSALSKIYHYHLHLDPIANPFKNLYCHQVLRPFDLHLLKEGSLFFVGTHDFTSFANVKESNQTDAIRTLYRLDLVKQPGGVRLEFEGNGFLYKMVRNITGTLLDIARKKILPSQIPDIFAACDRRSAGTAAPAKGLFLERVNYGKLQPNCFDGLKVSAPICQRNF
jgi:tRNA pseudouridine38-40 synthase